MVTARSSHCFLLLLVGDFRRPLKQKYHLSRRPIFRGHSSATDPVFFYGNLAAQELFELDWNELVQLPSRFSAEPVARDERRRLLDLVTSQGFIDNYSGVRIAKSGKRFRIKQATVWNLLGHDGQVLGQAAAFDHWVPVASPESE